MNERENYIESLLKEEKYISELSKMYNEMIAVRRFKRKLEDIEKEVTWYVGNESNMYLPDYMNFYNYAYKHYLPPNDNSIVQSKYKSLLGDYNVKDIPGYLYCLVLLGHLRAQETVFLEEHKEDFESLGKLQIKDYNILHCKVKLLIGFLEKIDSIVAVFINSIDMLDVKYLDDDIKELDSRAIKHRFMTAINNRDKSMAFKLLGRVRDLDEGEDYYFEALSHYINEEYDETIRYIDKIEKDNIDYPSAIALKLECYSIEGDMRSFERCIADNVDMIFEYWHIVYLVIYLILRVDISKVNIGETNQDFYEKVKFAEKEEPYYNGLVRRLIANIITEGYEIIETEYEFSTTVVDFEMPIEKFQRLELLQLALSVCPIDMKKFLDLEYIKKCGYKEVKEEVELKLLKLLIDDNPDSSFENIKTAFLMQLKLGDVDAFIKNVSSNYDILHRYSQEGESGAEELISLAYVEGMIWGEIDEKIKNHIEKDINIDLRKSIEDKKIVKILSKQGKVAYESAEWQFQKSKEEDYGWKDAGMISLGFYRILEVELNQKVIIPLLSSIGYTELNDKYTSCASTYSGEDKKRYKSKWGTIIKTYQGMEESGFSGNGFMLGILDYFFRAIGSEFEESDTLGELIRSKLPIVLNSYGELKFTDGFFEEITNDATRNKFRNPPAHTRYLPYAVACECREVFRKTILQLGDMLK